MRTKNKFLKLYILFLSLCVLGFSGETEAKNRKVKRKKRIMIDFQDELIEGDVSNPNIFHLFHKKQIKYSQLIRLRKDFLPEMRRTARELD